VRPSALKLPAGALVAGRGQNASSVELSAGDAPAGPFRVIGTFETVNARMRDPYQAFTFAPVTARYVKVKVLDGHLAEWYHGTGLWELRLLGTLK
jgi:hypothetical protein